MHGMIKTSFPKNFSSVPPPSLVLLSVGQYQSTSIHYTHHTMQLINIAVVVCPMVLGDHAYQDTYDRWQELVTNRQATTDTIQVMDLSIMQILDTLPSQVSSARQAVSDSVAAANRKSLGYGLGVAVGTVLGIQVGIGLTQKTNKTSSMSP